MNSQERLSHNFFEQVKAEHQELVGAISQVRHLLRTESRDAEQIRRLIPHLCSQVESHFLQEEAGGYLHQAVEQAPTLATRAAQLHAQHEQLLDEVTELCEVAQSHPADDGRWWEEIERRFEDFTNRLMLHEAHECDLCRQAGCAEEPSPF